MKRTNVFSLAVLGLLLSCASSDSTSTESTPVVKSSFVSNATATFTIEGMACEVMCAGSIEKKLAETSGVSKCDVDFENKLAVVEYNSDAISEEEMVDAIQGLHDGTKYKVTNSEVEITKSTTGSGSGNSSSSDRIEEVSTPIIQIPNLLDLLTDLF